MSTLQDIFRTKIWTRLFLMIVTAILLTWGVVGLALFLLSTAREVVNDVIRDDVPRVIDTARLSATTADLGLLSNRLLRANEADLDAVEEELRNTVAQTQIFFDSNISRELEPQLLPLLEANFDAVVLRLNTSAQIDKEIARQADALRWLYIDIEDEASALVADFAFNATTLSQRIVSEEAPEKRADIALQLRREQSLMNLFAALESDASAAATLGVQAAASNDKTQLAQFEALVSDTLSRVSEATEGLEETIGNNSLLFAFEQLERLLMAEGGLIENRKAWLSERNALDVSLSNLMSQLGLVQKELEQVTVRQTIALKAKSEAFESTIASSSRNLIVLTLLAALGGFSILFLYIRPSIIRPLRSLTRAMRDISAGREAQIPNVSRNGQEIAELAEAVASFADAVAARDRAIGELRRTQDELVQAGKMAALGTMSAGLAHELNQPLGAIRQRAYLAERAIARKDMPKVQTQVDKINDLVERMEAIISHLRRFARRAEIEKSAVKLGDAVDGAATFLKNRLADGGASLEVTQDARQLVVKADPVLLEQVIVNLISNASDAIAETDLPGTITIDQSASTPDMACFTVTDTGVGLSNIAADQAFDPFVTTKDPGLGMGLGLSISYNIMTGMGGTLRLEKAKRTGTRAVATLPIGVAS